MTTREVVERAGAGNRPGRRLTLLASRIHGADRFGRRSGALVSALREQHDRVVGGLLGLFGGAEVERDERGVLVAFSTPGAAAAGACAVQRRVSQLAWPGGCVIRLRMGIAWVDHASRLSDRLGAGRAREDARRGRDAEVVDEALRLCSLAHAGQILVSENAAAWIVERTPPGLTLLDLGRFQLSGGAVRGVHQLTGLGLERRFPPLRTNAASQGRTAATGGSDSAGRASCGDVVGHCGAVASAVGVGC
jgi:class 3 adenylate cyclase